MAAIPNQDVDPTLEAIERAMEKAAAAEEPRGYLGMSSIGEPCGRALWYGFRWASQERHSASTLRKFEDGHAGEAMMASRLRLVPGVELHTLDGNGEQFGFSDCDGHFRGHMDGAIKGLLQAPKTWHVWEHKQVAQRQFDALRKIIAEHGTKLALQAWNSVYWVQAQLYMHYAKLTRHYMTVTTPGGRDWQSVRTEYDKEAAAHYVQRARTIVSSASPPSRISDDPANFQCKPYGALCRHHAHCHGNRAPQATCRTCVYSTPVEDGNWRCERHDRVLTTQEQRVGCEQHLFIPPLISFAEVDEPASSGSRIVYVMKDGTERKFVNGPGAFRSSELAAAESPELLFDATVLQLRSEFDGTIKPIERAPEGVDPATRAILEMENDAV